MKGSVAILFLALFGIRSASDSEKTSRSLSSSDDNVETETGDSEINRRILSKTINRWLDVMQKGVSQGGAEPEVAGYYPQPPYPPPPYPPPPYPPPYPPPQYPPPAYKRSLDVGDQDDTGGGGASDMLLPILLDLMRNRCEPNGDEVYCPYPGGYAPPPGGNAPPPRGNHPPPEGNGPPPEGNGPPPEAPDPSLTPPSAPPPDQDEDDEQIPASKRFGILSHLLGLRGTVGIGLQMGPTKPPKKKVYQYQQPYYYPYYYPYPAPPPPSSDKDKPPGGDAPPAEEAPAEKRTLADNGGGSNQER